MESETLNKSIAFFDFDGTITRKDTLLEIIKFQKGVLLFYLGFFLNLPFIIAWKIGIISNHRAKQRILQFFFKNNSLNLFQKKCDDFCDKILSGLMRDKAILEIENLKKSNTEVVIVSASADNWIKKWADSMKIKVIATKLEIEHGVLTGRFSGKNCHGQEKVRRIREVYDLTMYNEIYCYGDSNGDKPLLALGTKSYYKPFR